MQEWTSAYNSFNSLKGLLYREQFDAIKEGKFLPPVEVNIDPVNNCQLKCIWCNGKNIIDNSRSLKMTREHLLDLIRFCKDWGVKAICFAGGGEPTLHHDLGEAVKLTSDLGMEVAIITNGLFIDDNQTKALAKYCRWIGVSLDAGSKETYLKCKGLDKFEEVLSNIEKLSKYHAREITAKFLIHPYNQHEISMACIRASSAGATCFHSRIVSGRYIDNAFDFEHSVINYQLEVCRLLESPKFKVYTINHKQEGDNNRRRRFTKCKASPLLCMLEANGDVSVCIDRKGDAKTRLCKHDNVKDILNYWGSEKHKQLLNKICPEKDCPKCTMTIYQELYNAYLDDEFCRNFP